MKHGRKIHKLGRPTGARRALLKSLATALFRHGRIRTTLPKARGLRPFAERLVTHAKRGTISAKRFVFRTIRDRDILAKLFDEIAPRYKDRNGGYTRIIRLGGPRLTEKLDGRYAAARLGDNAPMALIELV
ncbi:50S ribosomal protein L17 [bacterium]|nr:50S ribosomal protein L17 [bacterium]